MEENKPVGAVLVVGGGVAGIKAALDLASSGYCEKKKKGENPC